MRKKEKEKKVSVGGLVAGATSPTVAGIGAVGLMGVLGEKEGKHTFEEISRAATGKVRDDLKHVNMDKLTFDGLVSGRQSPHYVPGKVFGGEDYIVSPTSNTAVTAHELGHSSSKFIRNKAGNVAYMVSLKAAPIFGLISAYKGSRGEELTGKDKAMSLGAAAPMLYEETRANMIAAKAAIKLGGGKGLLKALPSLVGSQGSYLALGLSPVLSNYIARKAGGENENKKKMKGKNKK